MHYAVTATPSHPAYVVFMLDTSGTMADPLEGRPKWEIAIDALAETVDYMRELSLQSHHGGIASRFKIALITYNTTPEVQFDFRKVEVVTYDNIKATTLHPQASHMTNTFQAFVEAEKLICKALDEDPDQPAPMICHVTDGWFNQGGSPEPVAARIRQLESAGGLVQIENVFVAPVPCRWNPDDLSSWPGIGAESDFDVPVNSVEEQSLANYGKVLFQMSSPMTEQHRANLMIRLRRREPFSPGARLMFPARSPALMKYALLMAGSTAMQAPRVA